METVLVVGSTGNIGTSAVIGALRSGRKVLAIVRSQASAEKLVKTVGSRDNITFVEADITSGTGVKGVVDRVKAGELPSFQHVYSCAGPWYSDMPISEISTEFLRTLFNENFETNFFAYRDTIEYLREQNHPNSTFTQCTGAQGETAERAAPAMTQGALFSMATAACRENAATNVRYNELYVAIRVEVDADAIKHGVTKSSDFGETYQLILSRPEIKGCRVSVLSLEDITNPKYKPKVA